MAPTSAPEVSGSIGSGITGMFNVFVDPAATARSASSKLSWLWPLLILVAVITAISYAMMPYTLQLIDAQMAAKDLPPDQMANARAMAHKFAGFGPILTPVFIVLGLAFCSLIIKLIYGAMDRKPRFHDIFALLACCSLITMLQAVAAYFVLRAKGDPITSSDQMTPPFGLDIFLQSLHGVPLAFVGFFSIFEIWFIVVLVLGLASLTRSSKGQAFFASTPAWILPLLFRLIGAAFSKT